MEQLQLLSPEDADAALRIWWFGMLIANTDMHLGNLSFHPAPGIFRLAPVYDMLPMAYAPMPGGELPRPRMAAALPPPAQRDAWQGAFACALGFWQEAAGDERISADFRAICGEQEKALRALQAIPAASKAAS